MKGWTQVSVFFLSLGLSLEVFPTEFLQDRERGWYWFEQQKEDRSEDLKEPLTSAFDANQAMENLQKSLQHALNLAILIPTQAHVQDYLKLQIKAFNLSQRFTEVAKVLQVNMPSLDYQIQAPYHHQANLLKNQKDRMTAENAAKQLAFTSGLFFFFDSRCPYCEAMAPIVLSFAQKHGFHVISVSVDGGGLPGVPSAVLDNGMSTAYGVTHLPALFAVDPKTETVLKLSNRVSSVTELEDVVLRHHQKESINGH